MDNKKDSLIKKSYVVVLIVLIFLFYWYQIRPSEIRKKCSFTGGGIVEREYAIKDCMMKHGLEYDIQLPMRSNN